MSCIVFFVRVKVNGGRSEPVGSSDNADNEEQYPTMIEHSEDDDDDNDDDDDEIIPIESVKSVSTRRNAILAFRLDAMSRVHVLYSQSVICQLRNGPYIRTP